MAALVVTPRSTACGIFGAPLFHAALLLEKRGTRSPVFGHDGRLEMIGKRKDQMHRATRSRAGKPLPGITRQPSPVREFLH